jgi:EAL domain-containing protein (putative c-di-GMP-specific phosphodiesterase class I)
VAGYEALSRFRCEPKRSPEVWFAQAARVGLGVELELEALRSALELLDKVPDRAFLSLNVSAPSLCSWGLETVLGEIPGDRVVLELTEHELIEDYAPLNKAVAGFRDRGFRLAVDDAGAGCAGFSHILKVSPDVIKIDRTITRSIDRHPARQDIAGSLVALARAIGAIWSSPRGSRPMPSSTGWYLSAWTRTRGTSSADRPRHRGSSPAPTRGGDGTRVGGST